MTVEIAVVFGLVSLVVGIAGFLGGQKTEHKRFGESWGRLQASIDYVKSEISDIKGMITVNATEAKLMIEKLEFKTDESIRRLHTRMDEHIQAYHGGKNG